MPKPTAAAAAAVGTKLERFLVLACGPEEKYLARVAGTLCRGSTGVRAAVAMNPRLADNGRLAIGARQRSVTRIVRVDMFGESMLVKRS